MSSPRRSGYCQKLEDWSIIHITRGLSICTSTAIYFAEQPSLPLLEMYTKGITFRTGRVHAREAIPHVLELAAARAIEPERITTRVVPWADADAALAECDWTKLVIERS